MIGYGISRRVLTNPEPYALWRFSDPATLTESSGFVVSVADLGPNGYDLTATGNVTNGTDHVYSNGGRMFAANAADWEFMHRGFKWTMYFVARPFIASALGGDFPLTQTVTDGLYAEFFNSSFFVRHRAGGIDVQKFPSVATVPAGVFSGYIGCDGTTITWKLGGVEGTPDDSLVPVGTPGSTNQAISFGTGAGFAGGVDTRYYEVRIDRNYRLAAAEVAADFNSRYGV